MLSSAAQASSSISCGLSLRPYQEDGVTHIYQRDSSFIGAPMGSGKCAITITAAEELIADGHVNRVLVISTKNICLFTWPAEIELWAPQMSYATAVGTPKQRRDALTGDAELVTLNLENVVWAIKEKLLGSFDMLVVDESTKLKAPGTKRYRALRNILKQFKVRVALTGTPISQGLLELWSQIYLLDDGKRLLPRYGDYKAKYFVERDPNGWYLDPIPTALEEITARLRDIVFTVDPGDYADQLPDFVSSNVMVEMDPKVRPLYDTLRRDFVLEVSRASGEDLITEAGSGGVLSNKLRQLSSQFLYDEDGEAEWLSTSKLDAFRDTLEELGGESALVMYQYRAELDAMRKVFDAPYIGAGAPNKVVKKAIEDWNAGKLRVMYANPQSVSHGLNLQHGGRHLVWFSLPWSLEQFQQTRARLHRSGQKNTVFEHIMITDGTIDQIVAKSLRDREQVQRAVIEALRNVSR